MTQAGGARFSLQGLDASEVFNVAARENAASYLVTGNLFGGGTVTSTLALDGVLPQGPFGPLTDFQTFVLPATFMNLTSVTFQGLDFADNNTAGWAFDNISATVVPIPAALPLFMGAIAGLGFIGWRRRQAA